MAKGDLNQGIFKPQQAMKPQAPVECLGVTFANEEERREYFLTKLCEKLKDLEFRKIEGFPIGSDEDILALSDPPYYTACPNPFIADFIKHYGKPYEPNVPYSLEKLRERAVMKEFWEYLPVGYKTAKLDSQAGFIPGLEPKAVRIPSSKKIKVIRLEAVRAGFKYCWQNRDYRTIIAVAKQIPENVLQEDPKLLMWYDQALRRTGGGE
jgi:hypothetical protein